MEQLICSFIDENIVEFKNVKFKNKNTHPFYLNINNIYKNYIIFTSILDKIYSLINNCYFTKIYCSKNLIGFGSHLINKYKLPLYILNNKNEILKITDNNVLFLLDKCYDYSLFKSTQLNHNYIILFNVNILNQKLLNNVKICFYFSDIVDLLFKNKKISEDILNTIKLYLTLKTNHYNFYNKIHTSIKELIKIKKNKNCLILNNNDNNYILKLLTQEGNNIIAVKLNFSILNQNKEFFELLKKISNIKNFLIINEINLSDNQDIFKLQLQKNINYFDIYDIHSNNIISNLEFIKKHKLKPIILNYDLNENIIIENNEFIAGYGHHFIKLKNSFYIFSNIKNSLYENDNILNLINSKDLDLIDT